MDSQSSAVIDHKEIPEKPGTLHADVMFITHDYGKFTYMIGIDEQSAMTFAVLMKNTDTDEMKKALDLIRDHYCRFKHTLDIIHFDGDRGIDNNDFKAANYRQQTNVDSHTPGRHARRAEAAVKLVKRTFKATIVGMDYPCPVALYPYAIRWCIQCINLTSKEGNKIMAPWTIFTEQKLQFENHFNCKFGDIVITRARADDSDRPKSNKPVTTFGIILCRDDSMRGTYVILDLETKRTLRRRQFKIYPERNSVILERIKSLGRSSANTGFGHVSDPFQAIEEEDENVEDVQDLIDREPQFEDNPLLDEPCEEDDISSDDESDVISIDEQSDTEDEDISEEAPVTNNMINPTEENPPRRRAWKPSARLLESPMYCNIALFLAIIENLSIKKSCAKFGKDITEDAIRSELLNMESKDVWEVVDARETIGKSVVPSQLFLKPKFDAEGNFTKLKARLVACGNREKIPEGFRNSDVESPTANFQNILTLLQLAIMQKRLITISDVTAAYLNADIDGEIYMRINSDISNIISPNKQCATYVRLKKCLYGLRQSGRRWYELLASTLENQGFRKSEIEPCAFLKEDCWIVTYVDDIVIMSKSRQIELSTITALEEKFGKLQTQQGPNYSFLGLSMTRNDQGLIINQAGYLDKITREVKGDSHKYPHRNEFKPTDSENNTTVSDDTKRAFKSLIMKIMYLATRTRPDVIYNAAVLATKTNPTQRDFQDANRILRYLKATARLSILLSDKPLNITVFCDAAFNVHADRKSQSGYTIHLNDSSGPVLFKSKKQTSLAQSSTEAEIIALFEANRNLKLLVDLINETGTQINRPITVHEDNIAVIEIINSNKILRGNAKFIDRKYLQTREQVNNGTIKLQYVRTENQVADCLTKALTGSRFTQFRNKLFGGTEDFENKTNIEFRNQNNVNQEENDIEDAR